MKREDILKLFPDATDEQVTKILNQTNAELIKERNKADKYKTDAERAKELQDQLDEIESRNLSDLDKATKDYEKAQNKIAELESQMKTMKIKADLANQGIIGEQADKLVESLNGGNFDASILGEILKAKTEQAVAEKEKELLDGTGSPDGGKEGSDDKPTEQEQLAIDIGKEMSGSEKASNDIISNYI